METAHQSHWRTSNTPYLLNFKWTVSNVTNLPGIVKCPKFNSADLENRWYVSLFSSEDGMSFDVLLNHSDPSEGKNYRVAHEVLVCKTTGLPITTSTGDQFYSNNSKSVVKFQLSKHHPDQVSIDLFFRFSFYGVCLKTCEQDYTESDDLEITMSKLWTDKSLTDCRFQFFSDRLKQALEPIYAHSAILAANSKKFQEMFKCGNSFEIKNVSRDIFEIMLEYVYTSAMPIQLIVLETIVKELYLASCIYKIPQLKQICIGHMLEDRKQFPLDELMKMAMEHNDSDLEGQVQRLLRKDENSDGFIMVV